MSELVIAKPHFLSIDDRVWKQLSPDQRREAIARHKRIDAQSQPQTDPKVAALFLRIKTDKEWIQALKALWDSLYPTFALPPDSQFQVWINWHRDFDRVVYGMDAAHRWLTEKLENPEKPQATQEHIRSYISGCIKKGRKEDDGRA